MLENQLGSAVVAARAARAAVAAVAAVGLVAAVVPAAGAAARPAQQHGQSQHRESHPVAAAAAATTGAAGSPRALRVVVRADSVIPSKRGFVVPTGARVRVTASVAGAGAGRRAVLQAGRARTAVARAATNRQGVARFAFVAKGTGRTSYRVVVPAAAHARPLASTPLTVVVRPSSDDQQSGGEQTTLPEGPSTADIPADGLAFSFLDTGRPGAVFRWDPCTPVRYRTDLGDVSESMRAAVSGAVQRLGNATGLSFVEVSGAQESDLAVTVVGEAADPVLAGATIGYARITRATWAPEGDARIRSVEVLLEREYLAAAAGQSDAGAEAVGALVAHELGHAVGLGHSGDAHQVMYPTLGPDSPVAYGTGDLGGLARVGSGGGCLG